MDTGNSVPLAHPIPQACARIGVGRSTLFELIKSGDVSPIKVGRRTLIPESELQRFLAARVAASREPAALQSVG
jgi:excisionase family DNA binding protein